MRRALAPLALRVKVIPDFVSRVQEVAKQGDTVLVMCRSGGRSQKIADYLVAQGFDRVSNLQGGITAWSRDIDPSVPEY